MVHVYQSPNAESGKVGDLLGTEDFKPLQIRLLGSQKVAWSPNEASGRTIVRPDLKP